MDSWHIDRNSQDGISNDTNGYNRKKHLTTEIILIMILIRLSQERDETLIVTEALGPVDMGHALKLDDKLITLGLGEMCFLAECMLNWSHMSNGF
ncbi:hypothetical protein TNCV_359481 [Trichonephila clavipes]|nr:hypothetical protein TNCV_359481 [Trichonephila clavipes]